MLFIVRFDDHPDRLFVREQQLPAHIAWLGAHQDVIRAAGSLRHEADHPAIGGLWIVEAPQRANIEVLLRTDPFWVHGLRRSVEILLWSKAFPQRHISI
jgi:Uncharacterized protein conserved in bacteria